MERGSTGGDRRCPECDALVSADAEWCGQCFRSLREPERREEPVIAAAVATTGPSAATGGTRSASAPTWPCPACGHANPIELDACAVCGTTFAALMRQDATPPAVEPRDAMVASLLFPGLGHRRIGRGLDGLARAVLFTLLAAMAATMLLSGVSSPVMFGVAALFVAGAVLVYAGSAWEASHIADGGQPVASSRALLWATVVVVFGSVVLLAVTVVSAARS
jgi:hypothetical protein